MRINLRKIREGGGLDLFSQREKKNLRYFGKVPNAKSKIVRSITILIKCF